MGADQGGQFDVTREGRRILAIRIPPESPPRRIEVVIDWRASSCATCREANGDPTLARPLPLHRIFRQTDNGLLVRMALLALALDVARLVHREGREGRGTPPNVCPTARRTRALT